MAQHELGGIRGLEDGRLYEPREDVGCVSVFGGRAKEGKIGWQCFSLFKCNVVHPLD